jgi:hypothetical protein
VQIAVRQVPRFDPASAAPNAIASGSQLSPTEDVRHEKVSGGGTSARTRPARPRRATAKKNVAPDLIMMPPSL